MSLYLKEERDRDFYKVCQQIKASSPDLNLVSIARLAIMHPAPSLYISVKECCRIIYRIKRGRVCDKSSLTRQRLYREIEEKYEVLRARYPRLPVKKIALMIIESPASSFFITEGRAINLYYELIKRK